MANFLSSLFQNKNSHPLEQKFSTLLKRINPKKSYWEQTSEMSDIISGTEILMNEANIEEKRLLISLIIQNIYSETPLASTLSYNFNILLEQNFKKNLHFSEEELLPMIQSIAVYFKNPSQKFPFTHFLKQVSWFSEEQEVTDSLRNALSDLRKVYEKHYKHINQTASQYKNSILVLEEITGEQSEPVLFPDNCDWAADAHSMIMNLPTGERKLIMTLLLHGICISGAAPAEKWKDECLKIAKTVDIRLQHKVFTSLLTSFIATLKRKLRLTDEEIDEYVENLPNEYFYGSWTRDSKKEIMKEERYFLISIHEKSLEIIKGVLWIIGTLGYIEYIPSLKEIALESFKKIPGQGPRFMKLGNACLYVLGSFSGIEGVRTLLILNQKIKQRNVKKIIEKEILKASVKLGISPTELEDMAVSDFGFSLDGSLSKELGAFKGILKITQSGVEMFWKDSEDKIIMTLPKALKEYSSEISELKSIKKEVEMLLPVIKERLDKSYLQKRILPFEKWKSRYLEHPLFKSIAECLIWKLNDGQSITPFFYHEGKFIDTTGKALLLSENESTVDLWHPLDSKTEEVLKWREYITENSIIQPFKQAFREVYILTDAEHNTDTYSNRFAAHILKQHQFNNLCMLRGWHYKLQSYYWDQPEEGAYTHLSAWNIRAEYWVNARAIEEVNDAGVSLYITTDQVRFYTLEPRQEMHLRDVPILVFSEIMRDVDLFVGVGSVGNDPNWSNNRNALQQTYWSEYSFGNLSEISKTRKTILGNIIPKLKIASQCELKDKFLYVKGTKRTYKIHIGSGNILMEPNDQYLCIVSRPSKTPSLPYLPFEGDQVLSLILSKAFLLADDSHITDASIISQIENKR